MDDFAGWRMDWISRKVTGNVTRVLDVGGGSSTSQNLREAFPKALIIQANIAAHRPSSEFKSVRASIEQAPFKSATFDFVFLGEIIEHVYDLPRLLDEVVRIAVDGAQVGITTPNLAAWYSRMALLAGQVPPGYTPYPFVRVGFGPKHWRQEMHTHDHIRVFTARSLIEALGLHGIRTVWWSGVTGYGTRLKRTRRSVEAVLPRKWRESLLVLGRVDKSHHAAMAPNRPARASQEMKMD